MTIRLVGSTSGYTEIDAPAVAGSNTLVLPTGNGSADQALVTNGSGTLSFADRGRMTLATAQNSTSGTSIDFTGIPSWVKRVTVMFNGVSLSGSDFVLVQVGSGSLSTSGYTSASSSGTSGVGTSTSTSGFVIRIASGSDALIGSIVIQNITANTWISNHTCAVSVGGFLLGAGVSPNLSGAFDRVSVTRSGTNTFDAGSINILMEG
jgi:hypothetical protein